MKSLGNIELKPPPTSAFEPVFVETRLEDSVGTLLGERLHVFGPAGVEAAGHRRAALVGGPQCADRKLVEVYQRSVLERGSEYDSALESGAAHDGN